VATPPRLDWNTRLDQAYGMAADGPFADRGQAAISGPVRPGLEHRPETPATRLVDICGPILSAYTVTVDS
jgi:hypothetical protein